MRDLRDVHVWTLRGDEAAGEALTAQMWIATHDALSRSGSEALAHRQDLDRAGYMDGPAARYRGAAGHRALACASGPLPSLDHRALGLEMAWITANGNRSAYLGIKATADWSVQCTRNPA